MLEGEAIGEEFGGVLALRLIVLDHGAAAARIAGYAVHAHGQVGGKQPRLDQRAQRGDRTLRPAAGIGDTASRANGIGLVLVHFGEAIDPAFRHAMRRGGVNNAGAVVGDQRNTFFRSRIRQAKDRDIGHVEEIGPCRGVLAALGWNGDDLDIAPAGEPRTNLQACRAVLSVDEDFRFHVCRSDLESTIDQLVGGVSELSSANSGSSLQPRSRCFRSASRPR